jgi:hypothetical protein
MARADVLVDLRAYKADLAAELRRVEAALVALGADGETGERATGTYDLLRQFITNQRQFNAHDALCYLTDHGWQADKRENALNAVRTALAHLAAWGEIERVRRGLYRISAPQSRMDIPSAQVADLAEATG